MTPTTQWPHPRHEILLDYGTDPFPGLTLSWYAPVKQQVEKEFNWKPDEVVMQRIGEALAKAQATKRLEKTTLPSSLRMAAVPQIRDC